MEKEYVEMKVDIVEFVEKEAQLQQVDYGFMGSRIAAGNHAIKLDYVPDSNAIPAYISIVGIILLAGHILLLKKKSRG